MQPIANIGNSPPGNRWPKMMTVLASQATEADARKKVPINSRSSVND